MKNLINKVYNALTKQRENIVIDSFVTFTKPLLVAILVAPLLAAGDGRKMGVISDDALKSIEYHSMLNSTSHEGLQNYFKQNEAKYRFNN